MYRHLLLPTDGSELSRETARHSVSFAKATGARITAIYVKTRVTTDYEGDLLDPSALDRLSQASDRKAKEYLGYIKRLCKDGAVACDTVAVIGDHPYKEIVRTAEERHCDLIFMASHGRHGFQSLLLGSETQKVLTYSGVPVLVYRPQNADKSHHKTKA